jgi:hypothetical protein
MVQQRTTIQWAYEHYLVYLHLCIADSDCVISESEFVKIRSAVFPTIDAGRADNVIKAVYIEFLAHNDSEKKEIIINLAPKYLRTASVRQKVLQNLNCIANKDEECEERIMFRFIKKSIESDR